MTKKQQPQKDELSDQQLDKVAGGQEVIKLPKITVTASRSEVAPQQVVKLDKVVVTAKREKTDIAGSQLASADPSRKN
jgi:hypothetical protein